MQCWLAAVSSGGRQLRLLYDASGMLAGLAASGSGAPGAGAASGQARPPELPGSVHGDALRVAGGQPPASQPVRLQHDALGRLTAAYAADGSVTRYEYNGFGEAVAERGASGATARYGYDAAGNRIWEQHGGGAVIYREYDALDRMVSMRRQRPGTPAETFQYRYDSCANGLGRLCEASDSAGAARYEYGIHGNPVRRGTDADSRAGTAQFRDNANSRLEALTAGSAIAQLGAPAAAGQGQAQAAAPSTSSVNSFKFFTSSDCNGTPYTGFTSLYDAQQAGYRSFIAPHTVRLSGGEGSITVTLNANVCFRTDAFEVLPPNLIFIAPTSSSGSGSGTEEEEAEEENGGNDNSDENEEEEDKHPITHDYAVDNKVCAKTDAGCNLDNIACWLRHYHAPGKDSYDSPAGHGDEVSLDLGWSYTNEPVKVAVGPQFGLPENAIAQIPLEGHELFNEESGEWGSGADGCPQPAGKTEGDEDRPAHCNQVYREVYETGGNIHVATRGTGNNGSAVNDIASEQLGTVAFGDLDEDMIEAFKSRTWCPGQEPAPPEPPGGPLP